MDLLQLQLSQEELHDSSKATQCTVSSSSEKAGCDETGVYTFSLSRASLIGRVVRGMGAMGWDGASDMATACAG